MHYLKKIVLLALVSLNIIVLSKFAIFGESISFSVTLTKERCPSIHRHVRHQTLPQVLPKQSLLWSQHLSQVWMVAVPTLCS